MKGRTSLIKIWNLISKNGTSSFENSNKSVQNLTKPSSQASRREIEATIATKADKIVPNSERYPGS